MNLRFSILLIFIINAFIFTGCGYKPTSYYAKSAINGKVYVDIDMNIDNSSNSVIIKDIMNEMVLNQFEAQLTHNKDIADTHINVKLLDIEQKAISSDNQGYVSLYRTTVYIKIRYKKRDEKAVELKKKIVSVKIKSTYKSPSEILSVGASWAMSFTITAISSAIEDAK